MKTNCHRVLLLMFYDNKRFCGHISEEYKEPTCQMLFYFNKKDEIFDVDYHIYTDSGLKPIKDNAISNLLLKRLKFEEKNKVKSVEIYGQKFNFK